MLGILLIPLVIVLKYKPVPPTIIGIFYFYDIDLFFLTNFNQSPAEKYFFTEMKSIQMMFDFFFSLLLGLEDKIENSL